MNCNYCIYKDIFCFKPHFNRIINDHIEIIKNYKRLIFSNYADLKICIRTNNLYDFEYYRYYFWSRI